MFYPLTFNLVFLVFSVVNFIVMKNQDIKILSKIFKKYPEIAAVYLFGSMATGKVHSESDLDLAIVEKDKAIWDKRLDILADLVREGFDHIDLIFLGKADIVLQYEAVRMNKVIYHCEGFDRGEFYSRIVRRYLDFYPYLKVQREAYKERVLSG